MAYLTIKEFSKKWGISERRILKLCQDGRISGAEKNGRVWLIPEDTVKPLDKRSEVSQLIDTQKRVLIANSNTKIGEALIPLLQKNGYLVDGICEKNERKTAKIKISSRI